MRPPSLRPSGALKAVLSTSRRAGKAAKAGKADQAAKVVKAAWAARGSRAEPENLHFCRNIAQVVKCARASIRPAVAVPRVAPAGAPAEGPSGMLAPANACGEQAKDDGICCLIIVRAKPSKKVARSIDSYSTFGRSRCL